jgi:hypothetical protein
MPVDVSELAPPAANVVRVRRRSSGAARRKVKFEIHRFTQKSQVDPHQQFD